MKLNSYTLIARLYPTLLTSLPGLILSYLVTQKFLSTELGQISVVLPFLTHLGLSAALVFLLVQVNRLIAKEIFQRLYFQDELRMPTTNHLLWINTTLDNQTKQII